MEAQQALLVELLRRAGGTPVGYAELREQGVDLPASVVSELELAGFPVERCYHGAHQLGVRLDPNGDPLRPFQPAAVEPPAELFPRRMVSRSSLSVPRGSPALLAVLGVLIAVIVLSIVTLGSGGPHRPSAAAGARPKSAARAKPARAAAAKTHTTAAATTAATSSPPTPVSEMLAIQLESQGHALLQAGTYTSAVPTLRRAAAATGEQPTDCVQPVSQSCLTYAYALYDLGRALSLSGDGAAAVPVLQRRLEIDNQRPAVQAELTQARSIAQTTQSR